MAKEAFNRKGTSGERTHLNGIDLARDRTRNHGHGAQRYTNCTDQVDYVWEEMTSGQNQSALDVRLHRQTGIHYRSKGFRVDGICDSEMVFYETRQSIRHRLPDIRLTVGKNSEKFNQVGPLIGRSVSRSVDRSFGRFICWSVDRSVGQSAGLSVGRSNGHSVGRSIDRSIGRLFLRGGHLLADITEVNDEQQNEFLTLNAKLPNLESIPLIEVLADMYSCQKKKKVAALVNSEYFRSPLRVAAMLHDACACKSSSGTMKVFHICAS
ncbi:hypothetical protein ANN_19050 [Periplaneta americana]|uniref:Uncharacterized protein n=1 Tax=Periplaneta americana TaxID=6978 RepID=A0ABQ8SRZ1_PERAM|nr:hypothetical protein ANN_19050 [Periplaneta americana]